MRLHQSLRSTLGTPMAFRGTLGTPKPFFS